MIAHLITRRGYFFAQCTPKIPATGSQLRLAITGKLYILHYYTQRTTQAHLHLHCTHIPSFHLHLASALAQSIPRFQIQFTHNPYSTRASCCMLQSHKPLTPQRFNLQSSWCMFSIMHDGCTSLARAVSVSVRY